MQLQRELKSSLKMMPYLRLTFSEHQENASGATLERIISWETELSKLNKRHHISGMISMFKRYTKYATDTAMKIAPLSRPHFKA